MRLNGRSVHGDRTTRSSLPFPVPVPHRAQPVQPTCVCAPGVVPPVWMMRTGGKAPRMVA